VNRHSRAGWRRPSRASVPLPSKAPALAPGPSLFAACRRRATYITTATTQRAHRLPTGGFFVLPCATIDARSCEAANLPSVTRQDSRCGSTRTDGRRHLRSGMSAAYIYDIIEMLRPIAMLLNRGRPAAAGRRSKGRRFFGACQKETASGCEAVDADWHPRHSGVLGGKNTKAWAVASQRGGS
jgi:hypothetical protein